MKFKKFKIDFDKPFTFKEQFIVMTVILLISCVLFTVVYFTTVILHSGNEKENSVLSQEYSNISENSNKTASSLPPEDSGKTSSQQNSEQSQKPKELTYVSKEHNDIYNGYLILVNKDYECHHDGENTVSLYDVKSSSYAITDINVKVDKNIVKPLNNMLDDFEEMYGYNDIMVACGYRSYSLQVQLYNEEIAERGSSDAGQWVAPPGYSEHQTGYVFDFNLNLNNGVSGLQYDGKGIYSFINKNSYKYGFILRYLEGKEKITGYEYEPWHFRYVGVAHATYIMKNMITLEEYIDIVHMHSIDSPLLIKGDNGEKWEVYYVKATDGSTSIPVQKNYPYEISGDNFSGFIVTQKIK